MRLQRLHIVNVQSHEDSVLNIGTVTTIVGDTNAGKTSILRALRGFVDNASVRTLLRDGCEHMIVEVQFISDDGQQSAFQWKKGTKVNEYHVFRGNAYTVLRSVGAKAPEIVDALLQMGGRETGQGERYYPNFRTQTDPPPFVYASESERLHRLTQISGIGRLQGAMRLLQTDLKATHREVESIKTQEETEREGLEAYQDVEVRLRELAAVREYASKVLRRLRIQKDLERLSAFRQSVVALLWIDEEIQRNETLKIALDLLAKGIAYRELLSRIPPDLSDWHPYVLGLLEKVTGLQGMFALKQLRNRMEAVEKEEKNLSESLAERTKERTAWLEAVKTCPLCGQSTIALQERIST